MRTKEEALTHIQGVLGSQAALVSTLMAVGSSDEIIEYQRRILDRLIDQNSRYMKIVLDHHTALENNS